MTNVILRKIFSQISGKPESVWLNKALRQTAQKGDLAGVQRCVAKGAEIEGQDAKGLTALFYAAAGSHYDVAQWLLAQGASVHAGQSHETTGTALTMAARNGDVKMLKLLVAHQADINDWTYTRSALSEAIWHRSPETVAYLLEQGVVVNPPLDRMGMTPLMEAIAPEYREIAYLLARHGADMAVKTIQDVTLEDKIKSMGWTDVLEAAALYKAEGTALQEAAQDAWQKTLKDAVILQGDVKLRRPLKIGRTRPA